MITILLNLKETLVANIRRAMKNADANGKIVTLKSDFGSMLVYPNDNLTKALHHLKTLELGHKIAALQAKIG